MLKLFLALILSQVTDGFITFNPHNYPNREAIVAFNGRSGHAVELKLPKGDDFGTDKAVHLIGNDKFCHVKNQSLCLHEANFPFNIIREVPIVGSQEFLWYQSSYFNAQEDGQLNLCGAVGYNITDTIIIEWDQYSPQATFIRIPRFHAYKALRLSPRFIFMVEGNNPAAFDTSAAAVYDQFTGMVHPLLKAPWLAYASDIVLVNDEIWVASQYFNDGGFWRPAGISRFRNDNFDFIGEIPAYFPWKFLKLNGFIYVRTPTDVCKVDSEGIIQRWLFMPIVSFWYTTPYDVSYDSRRNLIYCQINTALTENHEYYFKILDIDLNNTYEELYLFRDKIGLIKTF